MKKLKGFIIDSIDHKIGLSGLDKELVSHGIDILVCDGRNFLSIILPSFFFGTTERTFLYLIVLSCLRGHTGGWHSKTEFGCFVTYNISYLLLIWFSYCNIHQSLMNFGVLFSIVYIIRFSPVEHMNNPLSDPERNRNQKMSTYYCVVFSFIYVVLLVHKQTGLAATVCLAFAYNVILMELLRRSDKRRSYGH